MMTIWAVPEVEPAVTESPAAIDTDATVPAMVLTRLAPLRACCESVRLAWAVSMDAWSTASCWGVAAFLAGVVLDSDLGVEAVLDPAPAPELAPVVAAAAAEPEELPEVVPPDVPPVVPPVGRVPPPPPPYPPVPEPPVGAPPPVPDDEESSALSALSSCSTVLMSAVTLDCAADA